MRASQESVLKATNPAIVGIVTAQVISEEFAISGAGMRAIRADIKVSGITSTGTVTIGLQSGNSVTGFVTAKSSADIAADGVVTILMNDNVIASDGLVMPLAATGRLIITTTHADDRVTIDAALITQGRE